MSPEQADGGVELDIRSDIHALGATLYNVLTGAIPFSGPDQRALLRAIRKTQPVPLRHLRSELPEPVERLVLWMLAKRLVIDRRLRMSWLELWNRCLGEQAAGLAQAKTVERAMARTTMISVLGQVRLQTAHHLMNLKRVPRLRAKRLRHPMSRLARRLNRPRGPTQGRILRGMPPSDMLGGVQVAVEQDLTGRQAYRCPKCNSIVEAYADLCECGFDVTGWREEMQRRQEREKKALAEALELERRVAEEASRESEEQEMNRISFTTVFFRRRKRKSQDD